MICTPHQILSDHIEKTEMGGACSTYGEKERCMQGFGGEPEGKTPLRRPRHSWEDNITGVLISP